MWDLPGFLPNSWLSRYQAELGSLPVFVSDTGTDVEGRRFEQAGRDEMASGSTGCTRCL